MATYIVTADRFPQVERDKEGNDIRRKYLNKGDSVELSDEEARRRLRGTRPSIALPDSKEARQAQTPHLDKLRILHEEREQLLRRLSALEGDIAELSPPEEEGVEEKPKRRGRKPKEVSEEV